MGLTPYLDVIDIQTYVDGGLDDLNARILTPTILYTDVPCAWQPYLEKGGHGLTWPKAGATDATKYTIFMDYLGYPGITNRMAIIPKASSDGLFDEYLGQVIDIVMALPFRSLIPHYELFVQLGITGG